MNTIDPIKLRRERLKSNLQLLTLLKKFLIAHPDQRFGQALFNLDILTREENSEVINPYQTESRITLTAAEAAWKRLGGKQ